MAMKNKYKIERNYISNKLARSKQKINKVRFLVAHETANNTADADNHYRYFNNITFQSSAHTFIDDGKILEIIPLNEKAWHVNYNKPIDNQMFGDDANDAAIGTELCRTGDFNKAYDRYVWYHAYLCKKFGLQPKKHIVSHKTLDPQRRSDPESWLNPNGVTWNEFINDVQKYYDAWEDDKKASPAPKKKIKSSTTKKQNKANLEVDGYFGKETTKALQKALRTVQDGVISGQYNNTVTRQIYSVNFGPKYTGSNVITALQKKIGATVDGYIGKETVRKLQAYLGTPVDGVISKPSLMVKELQRRLNAGTF